MLVTALSRLALLTLAACSPAIPQEAATPRPAEPTVAGRTTALALPSDSGTAARSERSNANPAVLRWGAESGGPLQVQVLDLDNSIPPDGAQLVVARVQSFAEMIEPGDELEPWIHMEWVSELATFPIGPTGRAELDWEGPTGEVQLRLKRRPIYGYPTHRLVPPAQAAGEESPDAPLLRAVPGCPELTFRALDEHGVPITEGLRFRLGEPEPSGRYATLSCGGRITWAFGWTDLQPDSNGNCRLPVDSFLDGPRLTTRLTLVRGSTRHPDAAAALPLDLPWDPAILPLGTLTLRPLPIVASGIARKPNGDPNPGVKLSLMRGTEIPPLRDATAEAEQARWNALPRVLDFSTAVSGPDGRFELRALPTQTPERLVAKGGRYLYPTTTMTDITNWNAIELVVGGPAR